MKYFSSHLDKLGMFLTKSMTAKSIMRFAKATTLERSISFTVTKIITTMEKENFLRWPSKTLTYWS
jgi:hypothetical protein